MSESTAEPVPAPATTNAKKLTWPKLLDCARQAAIFTVALAVGAILFDSVSSLMTYNAKADRYDAGMPIARSLAEMHATFHGNDQQTVDNYSKLIADQMSQMPTGKGYHLHLYSTPSGLLIECGDTSEDTAVLQSILAYPANLHTYSLIAHNPPKGVFSTNATTSAFPGQVHAAIGVFDQSLFPVVHFLPLVTSEQLVKQWFVDGK